MIIGIIAASGQSAGAADSSKRRKNESGYQTKYRPPIGVCAAGSDSRTQEKGEQTR
jgi:hypothetical protein